MTRFHFILAALLIGGTSLEAGAQDADSVEVWLQFYPLEFGDRWEYNAVNSSGDVFPDKAISRAVEGDTLMPNGFRYHIVVEGEGEFLHWESYERVDTSLMAVMRYDPDVLTPSHFDDEYPFLLLPNGNAPRRLEPGETWNEYRITCDWMESIAILGHLSRRWFCVGGMGQRTSFHQYSRSLAQHVGPEFMEDVWGAGVFYWRHLNYVRNSHVESGIQVDTETLPNAVSDRLEVYPNPARPNATLHVSGPDLASCFAANIVDMLGRRTQVDVQSRSPSEATLSLPASLPSGFYAARLHCQTATRLATRFFSFVVVSD